MSLPWGWQRGWRILGTDRFQQGPKVTAVQEEELRRDPEESWRRRRAEGLKAQRKGPHRQPQRNPRGTETPLQPRESLGVLKVGAVS